MTSPPGPDDHHRSTQAFDLRAKETLCHSEPPRSGGTSAPIFHSHRGIPRRLPRYRPGGAGPDLPQAHASRI